MNFHNIYYNDDLLFALIFQKKLYYTEVHI